MWSAPVSNPLGAATFTGFRHAEGMRPMMRRTITIWVRMPTGWANALSGVGKYSHQDATPDALVKAASSERAREYNHLAHL